MARDTRWRVLPVGGREYSPQRSSRAFLRPSPLRRPQDPRTLNTRPRRHLSRTSVSNTAGKNNNMEPTMNQIKEGVGCCFDKNRQDKARQGWTIQRERTNLWSTLPTCVRRRSASQSFSPPKGERGGGSRLVTARN